jgi:D-alanyl-D-alanine dipeptidase
MTPPPGEYLIDVGTQGIQGINFYWTRKERYNLSVEELNAAGVYDEKAYVHQDILTPLLKAQEAFKSLGYELLIKDAYRSPALYRLIQQKRYILRGKEETDKLLNMVTMPHSTGTAVDVSLIDLKTGEEIIMRDHADDADGAFFINYYKDKTDPKSIQFQQYQDILVSTMLAAGFHLGSKEEFWHFEYLI